jgi:DNA replication protein DnaC
MTEDIYTAMIELYCKELKMPGLRKAYAALAREAADNNHSLTRFLAACLAEEVASRQQSRLQTYTRQAKFPTQKTLQEFDFSAIPSVPKRRRS